MIIIFTKLKQQFSFADVVLFLSVVLIGGFNEFAACVLSAILCIYIFFKIKKDKKIILKTNLLSVSVAIICLMYGATILWAIDSGMAFIGFLKFLPLLLYLVTVWQSKKINFETLLPYFSAVMIIISAIGMQIPFMSQFFSVAGRLAGFFQYPNTFALFVLISEIILLGKEKFKLWDYFCAAVLVFGLLYSGSRTVFIIATIANIATFIYKFAKKLSKKTVLTSFIVCAAIIGIILLVMFFISPDILKRYLSISLTESTFVGRILYWVDALPLVIKYPFGMGYLGYNYIQGTVQTGWYSVRYVHNDFLQLFLDIGFVPAILFIVAIIKTILKKGFSVYKKIAILSLCAHSFFDFDLQFLSVFFLFILLLDHSDGKTITIRKNTNILICFLALLFVINIYMGTHLSLAYFKQNKTADKLYPFNTDVKIAMLENEKDLTQANEICDQILAQNTVTPIPYSVKAKYYYSTGDFNSLIQAKRNVFLLNPFKYYEYEEYCYMLVSGVGLYQKTGDNKSIEFCKQELLNTKATLDSNMSKLSNLGKKIDMQPQTRLPKEILDFISQIEKE